MRRLALVAALSCPLAAGSAAAARHLSVEDALAIQNVTDPRVSPDGRHVVYVVGSLDLEKDAGRSNLHLVPTAGGESIPLTTSEASNTHPRFSPDGRHLAFLSSRSDSNQIWLLDLRGGEPRQLSDVKGGVSDFEWSPDGKAFVFVSRDPKPEGEEDDESAPPPIVITRRQFKRDGRGYLDDRRTHLYVLDVESGESRQITDGPYDDSQPAWSPDGREIAFVSNRTEEPDGNSNSDIFLVPSGGGEPRKLTTNPGADRAPSFSPDGRYITYTSVTRPEIIWYATTHVAVDPRRRRGRSGAERARSIETSGSPSVLRGRPEHRSCSCSRTSGNQHLARIPARRR